MPGLLTLNQSRPLLNENEERTKGALILMVFCSLHPFVVSHFLQFVSVLRALRRPELHFPNRGLTWANFSSCDHFHFSVLILRKMSVTLDIYWIISIRILSDREPHRITSSIARWAILSLWYPMVGFINRLRMALRVERTPVPIYPYENFE